MTTAAADTLRDSVTYAEIVQQPAVWRELAATLQQRDAELAEFLAPRLAAEDLRIVLTGAGTSAFAGRILAPALARRLGRRVDAVATTDVVADPYGVFAEDVPTLFVSFARSGDSPESLAATALADRCLTSVSHLVVTCNLDGQLARDHATRAASLVLAMPAATNDRGFAMTSSFTSMLLGTWQLLTGDRAVEPLAAAVEELLTDLSPYADLAGRGYQRVVYLGSGPLAGLAQESALKLLELTAGRIVSYHDTPLGFRHGPKAVLDDRTLVLVYRSTDPYTCHYDDDIIAELRASVPAANVITLGAGPGPRPSAAGTDWWLGVRDLGDAPLAAGYVVVAQLLGLSASVALGCTPDNPFPAGGVNRVVQGVTVHPLP